MSTYRVPKLNQVRKEAAAQPKVPAQGETTSPNVLPVLLGGGLLITVIVIVVALLTRGGEPPEPQPVAGAGEVLTVVPTAVPTAIPPTMAPVAPTSVPVTPTPDDTCAQVASTYLTIIAELEAKNKWDQSAETAAAALADERVCKDDRPVFAKNYVTDAMEGLYARPFDPSKLAQEEAVERYQTIIRQAQEYAQLYNVAVPRSLSVAQRASQTGKFLLSLAAYNEGWQRDFTAADVAIVKDYISQCFNVGWYWTQSPDSPTYAEGLAYLSTSWHLEQKYRTGQAEAWQRLRELLGPNEDEWPEPRKTPLLEGGNHES